jgi:glyoxylase-like metal-dependent hydrolase (beta-lactamase superfamily II)
MVNTTCYILGDSESGRAVVIDPADSAPAILRELEQEGWTLSHILATHGHFDHILAAAELQEATGAPFRLHELDVPLVERMQESGLSFGLSLPEPPTPDGTVEHGDTITAGDIKLEVLHTPGHSPGSVSYYMPDEKVVFDGDCLFEGNVGRYDLPGGDEATLFDSIINVLFQLDDDVTVCPGHPPTTTIGRERGGNNWPVIQWIRHHGQWDR